MTNPITKKRSEVLNNWIVIMEFNAKELVDLGANKKIMAEIIRKCTKKARSVQKVAYNGSFDKVLYSKVILSIAKRYPENEDFRIITELKNAYKYAHGLRPYVSSLTIEKVLDDLENYCRKNTELIKIFSKIENDWLRGTTFRNIGLERGNVGAPRQTAVRGLIIKVDIAFKNNIPTEAFSKIARFVNSVFMKEIIKPETAKQVIRRRLDDMFENARPPKGVTKSQFLEKEWNNLWQSDRKHNN